MSRPLLVCFAVPQEAKPFLKLAARTPHVRVVVTGMGPRNARRAFLHALGHTAPHRVLTCGFAGALAPELRIGDVVCGPEDAINGARPVRFACVEHVAVTVAQKSALRDATGADAVEMESAVITALCRERGLPCATVRAISDTAHEDLPLDFNALLNEAEQLSSVRLALAVLRAPRRIPGLVRLGRHSAIAASRLAEILHGTVR